MAYCSKCGKEIADNASFCSNCVLAVAATADALFFFFLPFLKTSFVTDIGLWY